MDCALYTDGSYTFIHVCVCGCLLIFFFFVSILILMAFSFGTSHRDPIRIQPVKESTLFAIPSVGRFFSGTLPWIERKSYLNSTCQLLALNVCTWCTRVDIFVQTDVGAEGCCTFRHQLKVLY